MLDNYRDQGAHMYVVGRTGTGKSKFDELCMRDDIRPFRPGFILMDFHGTLYRAMIEYLSFLRPSRKIVLIDPSSSEWILPWNPFIRQNGNPATHAAKMLDLLMKPWGADLNQTPTLERMGRMFFSYCLESGEPITNAFALLDHGNSALRDEAIRQSSDPFIRQSWIELQGVKTEREWRENTRSLHNRLMRLLANPGICRFFGLQSGNVSIADLIRQQAIVLVNLAESENLDKMSARTFGSLLIAEIFNAAMRNAAKPVAYRLYIDEFQECITDDLAAMLDQVRKSGLSITLSHQHLGQLADQPRLLRSVLTNCRLKAIFGGLSFEEAKLFAQELRLEEINKPWIKREIWSTKVIGQEELMKEIYTEGEAFGSGVSNFTGLTDSEGNDIQTAGMNVIESGGKHYSVTKTPYLKSVFGQELSSVQEWSREEKVSVVAQQFMYQPDRHCYLKLPEGDARPFVVPEVRRYGQNEKRVAEFIQRVHEANGAIPGAEADRLIQESHRRFLTQTQTPLLNADPDIKPVKVSKPRRRKTNA